MRAEWPLVGRAGELRRMQRIQRGRSGGVVIAGPSGVGKTRLASEYLALLEAEGAAVVRVSATQATARLPLGALAPMLPADHQDRADPSINRTDLLRRCAATLVTVLAAGCLVLAPPHTVWPATVPVAITLIALRTLGLPRRLEVAPLVPEAAPA